MNFSRFFKYTLLFFLFNLLANSARPIDTNDLAFNIGQPLIYEIPRISHSGFSYYTSLFVDKGNRLFITTDQDVYIYDGINTQQIKPSGKPLLSYDSKGRVAVAGDFDLSLLTLNKTENYSTYQFINSLTLGFHHQITSLGIDDDNIYFSTGSTLWYYQVKPIPIDSSSQVITIYSTKKGLVFYSSERGFYKIVGKTIALLSKKNISDDLTVLKVVADRDDLFAVTTNYPWFYIINGQNSSAFENIRRQLKLNETILNFSVTGSYFFLTTTANCLLMFDSKGKLVNRFVDFGSSFSALPIEICTSDDINFFAITPTQIFRFINPQLVKIFNFKDKLKGRVNAVQKIDNKLYTATSFGLYISEGIDRGILFDLLEEGNFNSLVKYNDRLFAIGLSGLYLVNGRHVEKIISESIGFIKTCFTEKNPPKAIFLNNQGIYFTNLKPPYLLNEIKSNTQYSFINFISTDSLLLLKSANKLWYNYNFSCVNSTSQDCLQSNSRSEQPIINGDTLAIVNSQQVKINKSGIKSFIGRTYLGDPIFNVYSRFHPNLQTLIIEKGGTKGEISNQKVLYAINNIFEINAAFVDSDSCLWVSTSQGLVKVSPEYIRSKNNTPPSLYFFSISSFDADIVHQKYNGYIPGESSSKSDFRIKNGRSIEITLSGIGKYTWNNLTYSFKLDGSKSEWTEWSTSSRCIFHDLNPGIYTFKAKALDAYGIESSELLLSIRIVPNFFQTKFTLIALIIFLILSFFTIYRWRSFNHALERFKLESIINRRTEELVKEKEKTDNLLARVLPRETATELKETGKVNNQKFNLATVLFSDIQGFTKITDELNPDILIDQLDKFFLYFDSVVEKYKIEKIKTIGDAYMCAGGIPHKNRTNPVEVVLAALEMMYFMREINLEHNPGQDLWDLRIGIDTGPVIAGVVGRNKLSYDIWGTTVNTASRMESSGEVGKINISGNTHIFVQEYFLCKYRGKMPIKNKGDIEMYFVEGIKPVLSTNLDCFRPNSDFLIQLQFLRFGDLEEFILEKLEKGLPNNLYYHNLKHTVDVYTQVELIGRSESISHEEQLLLQTAALFHDAGHLIDYDTHEEMGVKLAREILPEYQYTERQIEIISELIMITKLPPKPKNLLEAIICDADLDYLGRTDFIPVSNMLYKELHEHGRIGTIQEWNELQIKFIEKHQYFTNTARRLRNVNKNSQLENIKKWIEKNKL